ncbi:Transcription factor BOA15 [Cladobotryum mycophilum]|uniref:Transcription factor BOA15 n=1 Tax=Cladobotryum mycophilum TaxID=491253 RepID=A0ABR0SQQ0_9HYPO
MDDFESPHPTAPRACASCQQYKRRCDKLLPNCSLCIRYGFPVFTTSPTIHYPDLASRIPAFIVVVTYSDGRWILYHAPFINTLLRLKRRCNYSGRPSESELKARIQELEALLLTTRAGSQSSEPSDQQPCDDGVSTPDSRATASAASLHFQKLFLDSDLAPALQARIPRPDISIPAMVMYHVGDQDHRTMVMSNHFQTVHQWIPIISKVRLEALANSQSHSKPRADFILLLLAMKLIQQVPEDTAEALRDTIYITTKEFAHSLEMASIHSLLKLQANLLIAVYEMGHAIFPAAYMSMGYCVTQAIALGIQNEAAPQMLPSPRNWLHYIGGGHRPLLTEKPKLSSHLPADDGAWDLGESVVPERLFLSSPQQLSASPFARLAQASHLLGEVVSHCNNATRELAMVQEELDTIYQAIMSLLGVLSRDDASVIRFYSAIAVCLSALIKLSDSHACDSFVTERYGPLNITDMSLARDITARCREVLVKTANRTILFINTIEGTISSSDCVLAPWFLNCIYQAATTFAWMGPTAFSYNREEYASAKALCVDVLSRATDTWKASGAYLEALELYEEDLKLGQY